MSTTKLAHPVTWFEVHTADRDRAKEFYATAFGWEFDDDPNAPYSMMKMGANAPIGGGIAETAEGQPSMVVFNVQVPDVEQALAGVKAAGGGVVVPKQVTPNGLEFAYVSDPDGSVFGLWTPPVG